MVTLASSPAVSAPATRAREPGWTLGAAAVVLVGLAVRLILGGAMVADVSACVMAALLTAGAWTAARLLGGPRIALVLTALLVALFDLAALPARNPPPYDDLEAIFSTDQPLTTRLSVPTDNASAITLVAQPVFQGMRPNFALSGTVNGASIAWNCAFAHDVQRLALPVPADITGAAASAEVSLRLSGSPSRESDYLIVYSSSRRGGLLLTLETLADVGQSATVCSIV